MAFIKVCPEHAKNIEFYATDPTKTLELKGTDYGLVPLYVVKDGTDYGKEMTLTLQFKRIGEYRIKTVIQCPTKEFGCKWHQVSRGFHLKDWTWTRIETQLLHVCLETVYIFEPHTTASIAVARNAATAAPVLIPRIMVTIEHLDS